MSKSIQVPAETISKWQEIVDLIAEIMHVPAALITRIDPPNTNILVSSKFGDNPYEPTQSASLNTYCETVMKSRQPLHVPDALIDEDWKSNPDIELGMISYLGVPISWPDDQVFGTICVLDNKRNEYSHVFLKLLLQCRDVLQADLRTINTMNKLLDEHEMKIRRLLDTDIIGVFIWEVEGRIIECNDAFLCMLGYEREDFVSGRLHWTDLTPPDWLEHDLQRWVPEFRLTGRVKPYEKEFFRRDKSRLPVLVGTACFEEDGSQGVAFVLDLTERKRAEEEALESERRYRELEAVLAHANRVTTLGYLVATISHEIKQPLAACAANAGGGMRWLSAPSPDLEEARQAFERVGQAARRASEITNRILRLVKNGPPDKESVQINEAICEVIALTHGEAEKSQVTVRTELMENLPFIQCDRVQLQQVILNLIINAIEAMSTIHDGHRELTIVTGKEDPGAVLVAVRDSGPGVAPENVERLFDPFYTTKDHGIGMGLSISRSIVQAHGGTLTVTTNEPRGAVFQFTLAPN